MVLNTSKNELDRLNKIFYRKLIKLIGGKARAKVHLDFCSIGP